MIIRPNVDLDKLDGYKTSIFLAGPTPRKKYGETKSWREEAYPIIETMIPECRIISPERESWDDFDYNSQISWELRGLDSADFVMFWVPRDMEKMPALTTNVEFGLCMTARPWSTYYGRPDEAPNNRYLDVLYEMKCGRKPNNSLPELITEIGKKILERSKL